MCYINKTLYTTEIFIIKAKKIHGEKYDYSKVNYINAKTKICIVCNKHSIEFLQTPDNHLIGHGCPKCGKENIAKNTRLTKQQFIQKARIIHGDHYDYSKVEYINAKVKIIIICPIHGEFLQAPGNHLNHNGCPKCGKIKMAKSRKINQEEWIIRSNRIHNYKYDYSKVDYKHNKEKVEIICPIHGEFWQLADGHIRGAGCPICNESKGEKRIREWLTLNTIKYEQQKSFKGCELDRLLKFDFYLPEYNLCIEYDGIQHFIPQSFSSDKSEETKNKNLKYNQQRDNIKERYCLDNNLRLLRVTYLDIDIETCLEKHIIKKEIRYVIYS